MEASYHVVETDGLTLIVSIDSLIGFPFEPDTTTIADQTGAIKELVWHREKDDSTFRLEYATALSLGNALILNNDIIQSCTMILKDVPELVILIQRAMALYTDQSIEGVADLWAIAHWLGEDMTESQAEMHKEPDPQQKAALLLRAICSPQAIAEIKLRRIVAQVAVRNASIEIARRENLLILSDLAEDLKKFLKNKRFKRRFKDKNFSALWYHRKVTELKQIAIPSYRLWCTPYLQIGAALHNEMAEVIDYVNRGLQFDATAKIQQVIEQLGRWQGYLDEIRTAGSEVKKSPAWQETNFGEVATQLNNLESLINSMPGILRLMQKLLRENFEEINQLLKNAKWPQASLELDHLIARCQW